MRLRIDIALLCWTVFFGAALGYGAENDTNSILKRYDSGDANQRLLMEALVQGTESGVGWANSYLKHVKKSEPVYCVPEKMAFIAPTIIDILRRGIREDPAIGEQPLGLAIIETFQKTFPCPGR
jgi:hypothetical protein